MKNNDDSILQPAGNVSRRTALKTGISAAGAAALSLPSCAFPAESANEELTPFLDMPRTGPNRLDWETLDSWLTPQDQVFNVQHYGIPEIDEKNFKLEVTGLVDKPTTFTPTQIRTLPKKEQYMTLECSGNGASKGFMNAIYNSKWTGTPLRPILEQCGIDPRAKEIVFIGADTKEETLRPKTRRELKIEVPYGRSMSMEDAMGQDLLLAYDRNDQPIAHRNGAPLRLIVPGWYGVANVKWLTRIEVRDRRYMGRYMGRDYVTVRGERRGEEIVPVETSVGRMNLKSVIARITRQPTAKERIPLKAYGAAWSDGTEIKQVEVRMNDGKWLPARLDTEPRKKFCWRFFSIDLGSVAPGKHTLVSRAIDINGRVQPATEDDEIALKKTYWEAYQQWPREIEVEA
ncbi:MAG TPA: molybdopterin-dependent oxidoreductase [Verrucomicrobiota bacterium]|nr:molybdopterin-dependent oxidoreductase [Verrucomicrobiota bacterium]